MALSWRCVSTRGTATAEEIDIPYLKSTSFTPKKAHASPPPGLVSRKQREFPPSHPQWSELPAPCHPERSTLGAPARAARWGKRSEGSAFVFANTRPPTLSAAESKDLRLLFVPFSKPTNRMPGAPEPALSSPEGLASETWDSTKLTPAKSLVRGHI